MFSLGRLIAALMLAAGILSLRSFAQQSAAEKAEESPIAQATDSTPGSGPDVFLLPDKDGKLRRVLGYRYEDFLKAWQSDGAAEEAAKPDYSIGSVAIDAKATEAVVEVEVRVEVDLHGDGWVAAPLQLGTIILHDSRIENGQERDFITFDSRQRGYVLWAEGRSQERRTIVIKGQLPVRRDGEANWLAVDLPPASSSVIDFSGPKNVEVESEAAFTTSEQSDDQGGRTRIEGARGHVEIAWGTASREGVLGDSGFEANADMVVVAEHGRLTYNATVTLTSLREPIERVRLQLPRGAVLSPSIEAGYKVRTVDQATPEAPAEIELRFDEATASPPPFRISAVQTAASADSATLQMAAVQVLGAFRQQGWLAIRTTDGIHAHFDESGRATRVEPGDLPASLAAEPVLAAFRTAGVTWGVNVHTQPRKRQVTVTPDYKLHLGSQGAVLDVTFDYQVSGGSLFDLRVNLRGWELAEQPIESAGVLNSAEQHVTDEQQLILPVKEKGLQQAKVRFVLRREAGLGVHDLPLPEAEEAFVLPGNLVVSCEPAWRVSAQIEKSMGVSPADLRGQGVAADAGQRAADGGAEPLLRLQTFLPKSRLAVDVSEREQIIRAASIVNARIDRDALHCAQQLEYEVLYQPAKQLAATVSADLLSNEGLEVLLNGKPLTGSAVDIQPVSGTPATEPNGNLRLIVTLPEPIVGRAVVTIRSHFPIEEAHLVDGQLLTVPLARPDQPSRSSAAVESAVSTIRPLLANQAAGGGWTRVVKLESGVAASPSSPTLEATASKPVSALNLRLEPVNANSPAETRVEAAWVQTWIAGGMRQDRMVYRFHTTGSEIELVVPPQYNQVEVLLDGALASVDRTQSGQISIAIPNGENGRLHTLEMRRHTPLVIGSWGQQRVAFPRMVGADAWSPFFWQLILPPDLAALATPEGMSAEYRLGWHGLRWGREPTQSQRDLEQWTNATAAPTPGPRTNQYVFSAFQPPESVEFLAVRRIWLVIAAGVGVFLLGLVCLYTTAVRSSAFWLALCIAAGGLLFMYPEAVVLLVQAVILGGAFTLLGGVTRWLLADAQPRRISPSKPASSVGSLAATQPWVTDSPAEVSLSAPSGTTYQPSGSAS